MSDLVEFLRARLNEDERVTYNPAFMPVTGPGLSDLVKRGLAEVEAKRRIIEEHPLNRAEVKESGKPTYGCETCHYHSEYGVLGSGECDTLRLLALPYADHPVFREEWRP